MRNITLLIVLILGQFTLNAQTNWQKINSGTNLKLNCISFVDQQIGYIGGNDSLLLKTTDGGKTWQRLPINITFGSFVKDVIDIWFTDSLSGYLLIGPFGNLYSTSDGGTTWNSESINQSNMCFKRSLYFFDFNNGFLGGSMCFQGETIATKENGQWDTIQNMGPWDAEKQVSNFDFYNNQLGLASGMGKYLFRTTNGGMSWDTIPSGLDTIATTDVLFVNDSLVYATFPAAGSTGILVSHDAGLTWKQDTTAVTFYNSGFNSAIMNNQSKIYMGGRPGIGTGGTIFENKNGTWLYSYIQHPINAMSTYGDSIVIAVGDSGYIVSNVNLNTIDIPTFTTIDVEVYPNPTNNNITIKGIQTKTDLSISNISGQIVNRTLLNKDNYSLDLEDLPSGLYFMRFTNPSGSSSVKLIVE